MISNKSAVLLKTNILSLKVIVSFACGKGRRFE